MKSTWNRMDVRHGHKRVEFLQEIWRQGVGWFHFRRRKKADLAEAKRADAEWALQFDQRAQELLDRLKQELRERKT